MKAFPEAAQLPFSDLRYWTAVVSVFPGNSSHFHYVLSRLLVANTQSLTTVIRRPHCCFDAIQKPQLVCIAGCSKFPVCQRSQDQAGHCLQHQVHMQ